MSRIPKNLREGAVEMLEAEVSIAEFAAQVRASEKAVCSLGRRFAQTVTADDLPRSGRLRMTTRAYDRYILNQHIRNRS